MASIPFIYAFLSIYLHGCFWVSVATASPLLISRAAEDGEANNHMSPRVIRLVVIATLLFVSILLALYLYRKCKPRARAPTPIYTIPRSTFVHPAMGTQPMRKASNAAALRFISLSRVSSSSSERTVVQEYIDHPVAARTRPRFSAPTAGVFIAGRH